VVLTFSVEKKGAVPLLGFNVAVGPFVTIGLTLLTRLTDPEYPPYAVTETVASA